MDKLIDEVRLAWDSIHSAKGTSGWHTVAILEDHPGRFRAGRSFPDLCETVLTSFAPSAIPRNEKLPEGFGFEVTRLDTSADGLTWLALTRSPNGNLELFSTMVADVMEAVLAIGQEEEGRDLRIFLGRIRGWQEFMRKGAAPLSAENEVGLVGELSVLKKILDAGVSADTTISSWVGPTPDGIRDFALGFGALEIKSSLSSTGFVAKIGSLEQLDDTTCKPIYVGAVKLALTEGGQTLPETIAQINETLESDPIALADFQYRLLSAGYLRSHGHHYQRRFSIREMAFLEVDSAFPCMTASNVKPGVISARYEINLEPLVKRDVGLVTTLETLGII